MAPRRKGMATGTIVSKTSEMLEADIKPQIADELIQEELNQKMILDIPLEDIYSAPSSWNEWNRLPEEKLIQLCQSLVEIGMQNPCIVWRIDKELVLSLYNPGEEDAYGFQGDRYMILSGHNRAFATKLIAATVEHSDDEQFQSIPCFVYEDKLSDDFVKKAKQIIDDTNYLSRDKTPKEIMKAIKKRLEQEQDLYKRQKVTKVTEEIAKVLDINEKTVRRYTKLNDNLNPLILQFMYDEQISFNDAVTLSEYPKDVQQYLYDNNRDIFTNKKKLKKFLKESTTDMTIPEVQEILNIPEKEIKFEKVTVSIPADKVDDFQEWFRQWKQNL